MTYTLWGYIIMKNGEIYKVFAVKKKEKADAYERYIAGQKYRF